MGGTGAAVNFQGHSSAVQLLGEENPSQQSGSTIVKKEATTRQHPSLDSRNDEEVLAKTWSYIKPERAETSGCRYGYDFAGSHTPPHLASQTKATTDAAADKAERFVGGQGVQASQSLRLLFRSQNLSLTQDVIARLG